MKDRGKTFAQIVYQLIIVEKRRDLRDLANVLGLQYDALYARVNGRTAFSADEIAGLIAHLPDPRLAAYLLRESRFLAVERVEKKTEEEEEVDIIHATNRLLIEASDVLEAIDMAFRDRRIDHREARVIANEIEVAERALVSLREKIRSFL